MPKVKIGGKTKRFPYTEKGKAAAKKAVKKGAKKVVAKKKKSVKK